MLRYFNIARSCNSNEHYMVDIFERSGYNILGLVEQKHYFIIHATRQSGKTTLLLGLVDCINAKGDYYALYCSLEALQGIKEADIAISEIVKKIESCIRKCIMGSASPLWVPEAGVYFKLENV